MDKATRSQIMARVRGIGTKPEMTLRKALFAQGFRYRLYVSGLPGKPDLVLPKYEAVIFVNGCFWHWHGCPRVKRPTSNAEYWNNKIERNMVRDQSHYRGLFSHGWRILVIWECAMTTASIAETAMLAGRWLKGKKAYCVIEPSRGHPRLATGRLAEGHGEPHDLTT